MSLYRAESSPCVDIHLKLILGLRVGKYFIYSNCMQQFFVNESDDILTVW